MVGIQTESHKVNELSINEEAKIVIDPGKAFCQMVKFKMRFQRKVKRFRERKNEEKRSEAFSSDI